MAANTPVLFTETLKTSLDVASINRYFHDDRTGKAEEVLRRLRPEGILSSGRYQLSSIEGGAGASFDFNVVSHQWGDWATGQQIGGWGLVDFVCGAMRCSTAQAVKFLVDEKFLVAKEAKKALSDAEGNPLIFPIPADKQPWEYVLQQDVMRLDRALITHVWTYRDLDGNLLGYKYRVSDRGTSKQVYTLTFRAETGWTKKGWTKKMFPLYGLETLSDGPTVRVLLVEGEKAADRAREILGRRWKVLAYSGVAGASDLWLPDMPFWSDAEVLLWPDNDTPGREAARRVQMHLEKMQNKPREIRIVRIESIPGLPPGWDLGDWDDTSTVDVKVELERAEEVDSFDRIGREWVYVTQQDQFHNLVDRGLVWSTVAFDKRYSRYGDKTGSPSKKFLSALETVKVDDLEFLPGGDTFVTSNTGKLFLNEWYPTAVYSEALRIAADPSISMAQIEAECPQFRAHLARICCGAVAEPERNSDTGAAVAGTENRPIQDALTLYFSRLITRPMDKQGWVPMMLSAANGSGKSYFLTMVGSILGGNRVGVVGPKVYVGQYHDWRDGLLFYELGEAKSHDNVEIYEEIKKNHNHTPFHFEKLSDRMAGSQKLNIKTRGMKNQRDFLNGFVTANDLFPFPLNSSHNAHGDQGSDRRLFVIRCEQKLEPHEATALYDELLTQSAWIAAWLMRFKPAYDWNPGWAPVTEHKRAMFEKDRERSENRSDKYELGKYDDFYHYIDWARRDNFAGLGRKVVTAQTIRDMCEAKHIKFPYQTARFDKILARAGILKGPDLKVDGELRRLYCTVPEMLERPDAEWKSELMKSINNQI